MKSDLKITNLKLKLCFLLLIFLKFVFWEIRNFLLNKT